MKILINERQYKLLKEGAVEAMASGINRYLSGIFTDVNGFYAVLEKIKDKETLNTVIEIIKNGYNKNFYDFINQKLDGKQRQEVVKIFNSNNLTHTINKEGKIVPSISKVVSKNRVGSVVPTTKPKGVKMEPAILKPTAKNKNLDWYIKNDLDFRRKIVAATLIGEAGGESDPRSMPAVLSVLNNRTKGGEIKMAEAALDPKDFSMWNGIPRTVETITNEINRWMKHPKWKIAYDLVKRPIKDITHGATHYYVYQGESKARPYWKGKLKSTIYPAIVNPDNPINTINPKKKTPCKGIGCFLRIGNHLFGKTPF